MWAEIDMSDYDVWDRYEAIRQKDSARKMPTPPQPDPVELRGELWLTGPGTFKGIFLRDALCGPIDINLPPAWNGKSVIVRVELDGS